MDKLTFRQEMAAWGSHSNNRSKSRLIAENKRLSAECRRLRDELETLRHTESLRSAESLVADWPRWKREALGYPPTGKDKAIEGLERLEKGLANGLQLTRKEMQEIARQALALLKGSSQ